MDFTLHQLRIFLKVAELESITKAAKALHLTQPAVSIQLKNLQDQFDIPLTEVIGRKLFITAFGKEMATRAARILEETQQIKHQVNAYQGLLSGELRLSVVSTAKYVMPYFLSDFIRMHPALDLTMDVTNKQKVVESLAGNEVDLCMVSVLPDDLPIRSISLMPNMLFLVGSSTGPEIRGIKDLERVPLIFREQGSATRLAMERYVQQHQLLPGKQLTLTSNEAVKQAVMAGLGVSVMPLIGIKNELKQGSLKIYPLKDLPITTTWQLVWLKDKNLSPAAQAYLKYAEEEKNTIIDHNFSWINSIPG